MPQQNQRYQNIFQQCVLSVHAVKYFVVLFFLCFFEGSVFPHKGSVAPGPTPPFIVTRTYTVAGSYSFTVPKGVTSMTIEAWGGGGRGGSKTTGADGAAGGGGGAQMRVLGCCKSPEHCLFPAYSHDSRALAVRNSRPAA